MHIPYRLSGFRLPAWLLKAGIMLGVLGYCLGLGLLAGSGRTLPAVALLGLPAGLLASMFASQYFRLVVLALPVAALAIPIEVPTGTYTVLPISLVMALLLTGIWCFSRAIRGGMLAPSLMNRPMLIFCAICVISLIWGIIWRDPGLIDVPKFIVVQIGALAAILLSISAALLIGNFVTTPTQLKYMVVVFLFFGSLMTLTELFHIPQRFLNDRGVWGLWTVAPAYGLLIGRQQLSWRWRGALVVVLVLTLYQTAVVNSDWLSGWIPSVVAIAAITFLRSRKAFVVLLVVAAIGGYGVRGFFNQVAEDNIGDGSLERISLWEQNWRVVREHWLFGTGPAGYALYYMTYYKEDARSTHNNYLDILAQFGFSGMLAWLWLAAVSVWEGWTLVQRAPPGFLRTLAMIATGGWVGAMASMLFGDWVLPFAYNQTIGGFKYTVYSWLFLGTLISIKRLLATQSEAAVQR